MQWMDIEDLSWSFYGCGKGVQTAQKSEGHLEVHKLCFFLLFCLVCDWGGHHRDLFHMDIFFPSALGMRGVLLKCHLISRHTSS